ncbi:hypothetical protein M422DRAFT_50164 [Sphaerobolus stellatus SS14]|uniref:Uncharacterized protein n=1 Tax=Sphaerobolus stellatus (strain SS14) TaxID=990650 RepID=A0A0C9VJW3_SPHS4|nr:hypothetical protein M422DRAFT_50164 [Sphaerobolus stellatus SS14]
MDYSPPYRSYRSYPEEKLVYEAFKVLGGMLPTIRYTLGVDTDRLPTNIEDELYELYRTRLRKISIELEETCLDLPHEPHLNMLPKVYLGKPYKLRQEIFKLLSQHGISWAASGFTAMDVGSGRWT